MLSVMLDMKGIAISRGAACDSGSPKPSRGLMAIGLTKKEALSTIRVSISPQTKKGELEKFVIELKKILKLNNT
jgi:cysteine desulfurase